MPCYREQPVKTCAISFPPGLQYFPTVSSVHPSVGSLEGGTTLTISGGGFPIDQANVAVTIGGVPCAIVDSNLEVECCREWCLFVESECWRDRGQEPAVFGRNASASGDHTYSSYDSE